MEKTCFQCLLIVMLILAVDGHEIQIRPNRQMLATASSSSEAQSKSVKSVVRASSSAKSTEGVATAKARASSEALTLVQSIARGLWVSAMLRVANGERADLAARSEVESRATAFASALAEASIEVKVEGQGEACGDAESSASAQAIAFAKAIASAYAEVENDLTAAEAEALAESISAGIAEAVADAHAEACTTGGFGRAVQRSLAVAIVRPIAQAVADTLVEIEGEEGEASSSSTSETFVIEENMVEATSDTMTNGATFARAEGTADTNTEAISACSDNFSRCCQTDNIIASTCRCTSPTCFANIVGYNRETNIVLWKDRMSSHSCYCALL